MVSERVDLMKDIEGENGFILYIFIF